jgi:hypothetical protein
LEDTMKINPTIFVLFVLICIKNSIQGITMPIIMEHYTSTNFIFLAIDAQAILVFLVVYVIITRSFPRIPEYFFNIILAGIFSATMSILMLYSVKPTRTPIFLQCLFGNLPIIPSSILRKWSLDNKTRYRKKYVISSILCIILAVLLSLISCKTSSKWDEMCDIQFFDISADPKSAIWIIMNFMGIISMAVYNVFQEKYLHMSADDSLQNRILMVFWAKIVESTILAAFWWLELFIGYAGPRQAFIDSAILFSHDYRYLLVVEGFIIAYITAFVMYAYLNNYSSNYSMLTIIMANPITLLFFYFFHQFNTGITYPVYIIIPAIMLSALSVILWTRGEKNKNYQIIRDILND